MSAVRAGICIQQWDSFVMKLCLRLQREDVVNFVLRSYVSLPAIAYLCARFQHSVIYISSEFTILTIIRHTFFFTARRAAPSAGACSMARTTKAWCLKNHRLNQQGRLLHLHGNPASDEFLAVRQLAAGRPGGGPGIVTTAAS